MDQLKKYLAVVGKHHFWVLLVVLVLIALVVKIKVSGDLQMATTTKEGSINGAFSSVQGQMGKQLYNASFLPEVERNKKLVQDDMTQAWEALYAPQREIFTWDALGSPKLREYYQSAAFLDFLQGKPGADMPQDLREYYQVHFVEIVPRLWEIIDVLRVVEDPAAADANDRPAPTRAPPRAGGGMGRAGGMGGGGNRGGNNAQQNLKTVGLVEWSAGQRKAIEDRYRWPVAPPISSTAVRVAQEDFWIYRAMLQIVAQTNEGATDHSNAPISTINDLAIAQGAIEAQYKNRGVITGIKVDLPTSTTPVVKIPGPESLDAELLDQRFVDETGKPTAATPPGTPSAAPYRLMPVYFDLVLQQAALPMFIGNCVNAKLPVRIKWLRIVAAGSDSSGKAAASGGAAPPPRRSGGGMGGGMGGGGGGMGGGGGRSSSPAARSTTVANLRPTDVHLIVYGMVLIYNPPPTPPDQLAGAGGVPAATVAPPVVEDAGPGVSVADEAPLVEPGAAEGEADPGAAGEAGTDAEAVAGEAAAASEEIPDTPNPGVGGEPTEAPGAEGASEPPPEGG